MLKDQDRIFLNLYGRHGADLESAKKRGAWNGTADMINADANLKTDPFVRSELFFGSEPMAEFTATEGAETPPTVKF